MLNIAGWLCLRKILCPLPIPNKIMINKSFGTLSRTLVSLTCCAFRTRSEVLWNLTVELEARLRKIKLSNPLWVILDGNLLTRWHWILRPTTSQSTWTTCKRSTYAKTYSSDLFPLTRPKQRVLLWIRSSSTPTILKVIAWTPHRTVFLALIYRTNIVVASKSITRLSVARWT